MTQRTLSKSQLEAFHHNDFVADQVADYAAIGGVEAGEFVDVGGGHGLFATALRERFPGLRPRVVDLDAHAVADCVANGIDAEVTDATAYTPRGSERMVCFNLVLHHLVGADEATTRKLQIAALSNWHGSRTPLFVNEYIYDSPSDISGRLIFAITSSKMLSTVCGFIARFVPSLRANTFGTGVRFRSGKAWEKLFAQAGYQVIVSARGREERVTAARRLLLMKSVHRDSFRLIEAGVPQPH